MQYSLFGVLWLIVINSDWDPTKWIIWVLHRYTPFVPTIATTPEAEVLKARAHVHRLHADRLTSQIPSSDIAKDDTQLPHWTKADLARELEEDEGAVFLLIDGYIVDAGGYLDVHVSQQLSGCFQVLTKSLPARWTGAPAQLVHSNNFPST